jgi:uncharacterized membrane protein YfhO
MKQAFLRLTKNKYFYLIISFLLPFLIFGTILAQFGIYPFGGKSILINDMFNQYIQFYNRFYDAFKDGKSLFYSWEAGLGLNFLGVIAYYLSSPLSILILFFERNHLPEALILITLCKIGLSGLTMYLFLNHFKFSGRMVLLIFSTLYALMTFSVVYSFNLMWLDGIYMLPLVLLGVEILIKKGQGILFLISLAILFIANFYISYMVGIFSFLYFIVRYFSINSTERFSSFIKNLLLFSLSTGIAAGLSAFLLLPTYKTIKANTIENTVPQVIPDINILDLYLKFFNGSFDSVVNGLPNIYVGLLTVLLFPLFFFLKKIPLKEKVLFLLLTLFLFISFQNSTLYFLWHGMDNPNWFPYRFSFLLSFLAVFLAFRTFVVLDKGDWGYVKGSFLFNIFFILLMSKLSPDKISNKMLAINIVLLSLYFIIIYCKLYLHNYKRWLQTLLILVVCLDVSLNSAEGIRSLDRQFGYIAREKYNVTSEYKNMMEWISKNDHSFYRIDVREPVTWNDSMQMKYKKMDSFNSLSNNDMNHFLNELGYTFMEGIFISLNSGIIPTDSLLGFKYIVSSNPINKQGYDVIHQEGNLLLYLNKNTLPLGFVLNDEQRIIFPKDADNPFKKQNQLFINKDINQDSEKLFTPVEPISKEYLNLSMVNEADGQKFIKNDKSKPAFIKYSFSVSNSKELYSLFRIAGVSNTNVIVNNSIIRRDYPTIHDNQVLDLGGFQNETVSVKLEVLPDELKINDRLFYQLDMNLYEEKVKEIKTQTLRVKSFSDTRVTGKIKMNQGGVLFLSIPYDSGWGAVVDGKKTKLEKVGGFLGVDLKEGKHEVELNYVPPGFFLGLIISACSLIIFFGLLMLNLRKRIRKKNY